MNLSFSVKAILSVALVHAPYVVNAGKIDSCRKQSNCFDLTYEPACDNNCGIAGECDWKICLTTTYGGDCAKGTEETVSHTCKKEECASGLPFSSTIDNGIVGEIASVGDGDVQCQIVAAGGNVEFLLKDANTCADSFTGSIDGLSTSCEARDAATESCTGNDVGVECIWTVAAPTDPADCSTCSPPPPPPSPPTDTINPTSKPTAFPTDNPTASPTDEPTASPTDEPTASPTDEPTAFPTDEPTASPTDEPTAFPTDEPTEFPTDEPTAFPTDEPTASPTDEPTASPTDEPTAFPTDEPTASPTDEPTAFPTDEPTEFPTSNPTASPSLIPSSFPSAQPSSNPSASPSSKPSASPSASPSSIPSSSPSAHPSSNPSASPSSKPSASPSSSPSSEPSVSPSLAPSAFPSSSPSMSPSAQPSVSPSAEPSSPPSISMAPSSFPSAAPSMCPVTNIDPQIKKNTCFVNSLNSPTCNSGNCKELYLMGTSGIEDNFVETEDGLYAPTDTCSESGQALSNIVTFNYCKCEKTEDETTFATFPVDLINRSAIKKCGTKCYVYGYIDLDQIECDGNTLITGPLAEIAEEVEVLETASATTSDPEPEPETTDATDDGRPEPDTSTATTATCAVGSCSLCEGKPACQNAGCVFKKGQCSEGSGKTDATMYDALCGIVSDIPILGSYLCGEN